MEIFNRKLNMINIARLIILLFLVKHAASSTDSPSAAAPTTDATTHPSTTLNVATQSPTEKPSTTIASLSNDTNKLPVNMSANASPSPTTGPTGPPKTTSPPTTTTPKPPDTCYMYEISCNTETCPVNEKNIVHFPNDVKLCNRTDTGYCFVNKIVDSKNQSIANYTMGCNTNCNYEKDTTGCCNSNLCNGDLSLLNSGQYVKYNFLMSVLCIAISLFRLDIYF